MAIARDAHSFGSATGTSITLAHTVSGTNRLLTVSTFYQANESVTSITYNGAALTFIGRFTQEGAARNGEMWYIAGPATGTNNIVVTGSGSIYREVEGQSYTGVAQTGTLDASGVKNSASSTSATISLTTVAQNCWMIIYLRNDGATPAASTGSSLIAGGGGDPALFDTNGAVAAGSNSMSFTSGTAGNWDGVMASFAPAASSASPSPRKALLGVGL